MDDVRRCSNEIQCRTCYDVIYKIDEKIYIDGICGACINKIPDYIQREQWYSYLELKNG